MYIISGTSENGSDYDPHSSYLGKYSSLSVERTGKQVETFVFYEKKTLASCKKCDPLSEKLVHT